MAAARHFSREVHESTEAHDGAACAPGRGTIDMRGTQQQLDIRTFREKNKTKPRRVRDVTDRRR
jgi:hypothetical protein